MDRKSIDRKSLLKISVLVLFIIASAVIVILLAPWFFSLRDEAIRDQFKAQIQSMGTKGVFLMLGIQVLQVIVAILPGEPVELLAGMVYGTWGGLLLCLAGLAIGSVIVFFTVRALGSGFVERMFSKEKVRKLAFLQDSKRLELLTFTLFFIPGTPKDILTYVAPLTRIKPRDFLLISSFARIPSIISSTYAGQTFVDGEWWKTAAIFLLMGVIGIAGILLNNSIVEKHNKKPAKGSSTNQK